MENYVWQSGSRITNKTANAQIIGTTLAALAVEHHARLTPRLFVDAARPLDSPLHPLCEWDDVRCGELYREHQARHVLASIRIVQPPTPSGEPRSFHAYVSLTEDVGDETQRAYVPLFRVMNDGDLLQRAIAQATSELRAFEQRYAEFDLIVRAVQQAREQLEQPSLDI